MSFHHFFFFFFLIVIFLLLTPLSRLPSKRSLRYLPSVNLSKVSVDSVGVAALLKFPFFCASRQRLLAYNFPFPRELPGSPASFPLPLDSYILSIRGLSGSPLVEFYFLLESPPLPTIPTPLSPLLFSSPFWVLSYMDFSFPSLFGIHFAMFHGKRPVIKFAM